MSPSSLEQFTTPSQGGLSALDRLKLKLPQTKQPPLEVSPTAATSEDLAMLERAISLEAVNYPIEEDIILDEITTFEPPAFVPQPISTQPAISAFNDIKPLAPTQPAIPEAVIQPDPVNPFLQSQPEILPVKPAIPQQQMAPKLEIAAPTVSNNVPKSVTPIDSSEIVPTPPRPTTAIGFINKYLPFIRKDPSKVSEPVLESGKNNTIKGGSALEDYYIKQLSERKGDR
jgi:hypothetical protein